jgi:NAD(P)-dependent dehydrogenase (short-subunit alcohol dehydrogenase family)
MVTLSAFGLTAGIGAGIATAFAKYSPKDSNAPHIILIGRSRPGADAVIAEMKRVNGAGKYEFVQGDLTMMKNVEGVAKEVRGKVDKINYLCMSQGMLSLKGQDDTEEGVDRKVALHFYSRYVFGGISYFRFLLGNLLIPNIEKASVQGEDARLLTVLAAGRGGSIDVDDLANKEKASLSNKADYATTYNDLMVEVIRFT